MADFVAVLKKTLDGLSDTTPQMREKVYEKARVTISGKLMAMNPPLPEAVVARQKQALEEAILQVEAEFNRKAADPLSELESVFASLKNPDPRAVLKEAPRTPPPAPPRSPVPERPPVENRQAVERPVVERPPVEKPAERPVVERPAVIPRPAPAPTPAPSQHTPAPSPSQPAPPPVQAPVTAAEKQPPVAEFTDDPLAAADDDTAYQPDNAHQEYIADDEPEPRRRGYGRWVAAVIVLALAAGGAYAYWAEREQVEELIGQARTTGEELWTSMTGSASSEGEETPAQGEQPPAGSDLASANPEPSEPDAAEQPAQIPAANEPASDGPVKFTQRLNTDGTESDAGPAGGAPMVGEGTSIAAVTQPPSPQADTSGSPAGDQQAASEPLPGTPDASVPTPDASSEAPEDADGADASQPPAGAGTPPGPDEPTDTAGAQAAADGTPPAAAGGATPPADTDGQPTPTDATAGTAPPVEGTDTAAATPGAAGQAAAPSPDAAQTPPQDTAQTTPQAASVPVGQRAFFYEERTSSAEASAEPGSIVWSLVQESPGNDLPPEPAIRAEATIPGKDVQLRMTIRRNADKTLPASHIVEMIFLTPPGFEGGGIETVLRMSLKGSEQEAGSPLLGIPAKIADGFFLIALNDSKPDADANTSLLRRQSWIDVPVQYKSGRRALFTMEKGIPGAKVFDEAMKAWQAQAGSSG